MKGPGLIVVVLFASLIAFVCAAPNVCTFNDRPESLPVNLDSISYLGLEKEFHTHGEYYVNFTAGSHDMNFTLTEESALRIYVAPHYSWDIDLYLYSASSPNYLAVNYACFCFYALTISIAFQS